MTIHRSIEIFILFHHVVFELHLVLIRIKGFFFFLLLSLMKHPLSFFGRRRWTLFLSRQMSSAKVCGFLGRSLHFRLLPKKAFLKFFFTYDRFLLFDTRYFFFEERKLFLFFFCNFMRNSLVQSLITTIKHILLSPILRS